MLTRIGNIAIVLFVVNKLYTIANKLPRSHERIKNKKMTSRKVRVKRGHAPLTIYSLPDKEIFDRQWEKYMTAYHGPVVHTDWGQLTGDQTREKLMEIFNASTDAWTIQRYQAWWNALRFQAPVLEPVPIPEPLPDDSPDLYSIGGYDDNF